VAAAARCMCDSETAPFVHAAAVSGPDSDGEQGPTGRAAGRRGRALHFFARRGVVLPLMYKLHLLSLLIKLSPYRIQTDLYVKLQF
jgi:hypothetical protein